MTKDFIYPVDLKYKFMKKNRNENQFFTNYLFVPSLGCFVVLLVFILIICNSCTHNPIFPLKKTEQTTISGSVKLSDGLSPENTFVWLEDFNIYTYLEEDGKFELTLSPAVSQGIDGGISGIFEIYIYHPNYILDSSSVKLVNGKIAKNQDNIANDGSFKSEFLLQKFFSHSVSIDTIGENEEYPAKEVEDSLRVTVKLRAFSQDVLVKTRIWNKPIPNTNRNTLRRSGVIFYSEEYDHQYDYLHVYSFYYHYTIPAETEVIWNEYILPLYPRYFHNTEYKVIPYVLPVQVLPSAMLYCMGKYKFEFTPEYMELPLQSDDCVIHVDGTIEE